MCSHQEVPLCRLIKNISLVISVPVSNAYVETSLSLRVTGVRSEMNAVKT